MELTSKWPIYLKKPLLRKNNQRSESRAAVLMLMPKNKNGFTYDYLMFAHVRTRRFYHCFNKTIQSIFFKQSKMLHVFLIYLRLNRMNGDYRNAKELEVDISHARRLLNTLVEENLLVKKERKYTLGLSVLNLSGIVNSHLNIHLEARPILQPIVEQLGITIHMGILEGTKIIYLDKLEASHPIKMASGVGHSHPSYCTGCGKAILSFSKGR